MKTKLLILTTLIMMLSSAAFSQNVHAAHNSEPFEYLWHIDSYNDIEELIRAIDELGEDGWELIAVTEDADAFYTLFFKRMLAKDNYTWEYNAYINSYADMQTLVNTIDELGEDGWELVAVTEDADAFYTMFFKRMLTGKNYKWEYMTHVHPHKDIDTLIGAIDKVGKDGWELVAVTEDANAFYTLFFKRKLTEDNNRWEYFWYINSYDNIDELLVDIDELGEHKWELVAVTEDAKAIYTLFFMRSLD